MGEKFITIVILVISFLVPLLMFELGITILIQTNFLKEGILLSLFPIMLGILIFFALNLHEVIKELRK